VNFLFVIRLSSSEAMPWLWSRIGFFDGLDSIPKVFLSGASSEQQIISDRFWGVISLH
jgi:hypothetical protein